MGARDAAAPGSATRGRRNTDADNVKADRIRRRRARQYARAFELYRPDPPIPAGPVTAREVRAWRSAVMHLRAHGYDVTWAVPAHVLHAAQEAA